MISTVQTVPVPVLEILRLPSPDDMTADQARGADCVWCAVRLTAETAVALGEHLADDGVPLFLRACREDLAERAHRGLYAHAPMCEQCTDDASGCDVTRWLYRLVREARR